MTSLPDQNKWHTFSVYCLNVRFYLDKMSFIQFESGREKDKLREELRAARNDLLKQVNNDDKRFISIIDNILFMFSVLRQRNDRNFETSEKCRKHCEERTNGCYHLCQRNLKPMRRC